MRKQPVPVVARCTHEGSPSRPRPGTTSPAASRHCLPGASSRRASRLALRCLASILLIAGLFAPTVATAADLDRFVSVQGMVHTSAGSPASGTFDMIFGLYAAETGGSALWSQQKAGVAVEGGVFDVELGPLTTGPLEAAGKLWLQTTVDGTPLPRQPLRATPYALVAQTANTLQCTGCVLAGALADGAVTPGKLASGTYAINISGNAASANTAATAASAAALTGPLAGDVTGTQGATSVRRIRGVDVSSATPAANQVLKFNSGAGQWEPSADAAGAGTVTKVSAAAGLQGGPITTTGSLSVRVDGQGGLSKTLGAGSNALGIKPAGITPGMVGSGTYGISISGNAATATTAAAAASFTGALGGDVTGTQGSTQVARIRGVDVATSAPSNGQVLKYNGSQGRWEPATDSSGTGTVKSVATGAGLTGGTITSTGTIHLRLSAGGGLSKTINGNELGIVSGGVVPSMVSGGLYAISISGNAATATSAASATTAGSFTGSLSGDVTGSQSGTTVARIRGFSVATTTPSNGQVLKFNSSASRWEPSSDLQGSGVTKVTASSPLASSGGSSPNLTLGTVPISKGGTGITTSPSGAGLYLRSSGSGQWAVSGLSAGDIPSGSAHYIRNGTSNQSANFRISGYGRASTMYVDSWFRAYGKTGIYFQDYGGGFHMEDTSWVRVYNGKGLYASSGTIRSDKDMRAPRFYDQNNTGYYVDPASTSNLNGLNVGGKSIAAYIRDYVNTNCYIYYGWRDNCSGCSSISKYGRVRGLTSGCSTTGSNGDCSMFTLFGQAVRMYGLNTDGDVDGNDKFWIGFKCQ